MGLTAATKKLLHKLRHGDDKHLEVQQLQPVALAGASLRSHARSELCNSFAVTVVAPDERDGPRRKAVSDGTAPGAWRQCHMCARSFAVNGSALADFCSVDCRSAAMYRGTYHYK